VTVNDLSTKAERVRVASKDRVSERYVEKKTARESTPAVRTGANRARRTETSTTTVTTPETRSYRPDRRRQHSSTQTTNTQIIVNNNNNVIVQGTADALHTRPHISTRHLNHTIHDGYHGTHWNKHESHNGGFYFSFSWSGSSCGRVVYLPYRYRHSWCHRPVVYHRPCYGLSYYYPRYHRKYIYVSIGGYWPNCYRYRRYYWYGCHPYYWYGTYVIGEPYQNVNYNTYNTYNYYTTDNMPSDTEGAGMADEPEFETAADLCFAHAVELFEAGNYDDAVLQFREAVLLSPDDIVLPFTYCQALFANGDYALAASVLREAVAKIPEDELTVYFPRGLYKEEDILLKQIQTLKTAVKDEPFASDYQLLLGYQYLGIGELEKAYGLLLKAADNPANEQTAAKLLELAAKLEDEASENE